MENTSSGNAIVCATDAGWILPGGSKTNSAAQARMHAVRMNQIVRG